MTIDPTKKFSLNVYKPSVHDYRLKMLVYGDPGVGKTVLAATAMAVPSLREVLFINVESGILSITDAEEIGVPELPDIKDFNSFKELEDIFLFLVTQPHGYKTVVVDSLSELQKYNLDSIVGEKMGKASKSGQTRTSPDDIWQEDYGESTQNMRRVVRRFRDLPMNVIFTCHAVTSQDESKKEVIRPALTPKLCTSVEGYVDVVGYLYTKEVVTTDGEESLVRKLLVQPYGKFHAKDRSPGGRLGTVIEQPTMTEIMRLIHNKEK